MGHQTVNENIEVIDVEKKSYTQKSVTDESSTASDNDYIGVEGYVKDLEWTPEEERAVVRKIDFHLFPYVLLMNFVLNMDRTNISNALSDNLAANLGFGITGINTGTLIHSITFTVGALFANVIVKRMGAHVYIPTIMNAWAISTWAHALLQNYKGYLVVRFFVALTESGFLPAALTYVNGWYKTKELATRLAWFWAVQSLASAFSGLISFGILRMAGIAGLYGWKWLFIIDGIFTHVVGIIAFFYLPANPATTKGWLRGKNGWFTERQKQIAVTRIIRDDMTKRGQDATITWHDVKISLLDTKVWTHICLIVLYMMHVTPLGTYLPTLIKSYGFSTTTSNLLTVPSHIICLVLSIIIARSADTFGNYVYHVYIGALWSMAGFLSLVLLPDSAGKWTFYACALFTASMPSFHGMQIAWMSSNLAPSGKRTLALGYAIAAANIAGVPGSQVYQAADSPRYIKGNWVLFGVMAGAFVLINLLRLRYSLTNKYRERKWNAMSDFEKSHYLETTKHEGSNRLDYRFRL